MHEGLESRIVRAARKPLRKNRARLVPSVFAQASLTGGPATPTGPQERPKSTEAPRRRPGSGPQVSAAYIIGSDDVGERLCARDFPSGGGAARAMLGQFAR